jgi:hypothetical protein
MVDPSLQIAARANVLLDLIVAGSREKDASDPRNVNKLFNSYTPPSTTEVRKISNLNPSARV